MNPADVYDLLATVVEGAEREVTLRARAIYETLKIEEKIPIAHRAEDAVFRAFHNQGMNVIRSTAVLAARKAAHNAGINDYFEVRKVEASAEYLAAALLAKPFIKAEEFSYLIRPWAAVLPEDVASPSGTNSDTPPPPPLRPRSVSVKEQKAIDKKNAREQKERDRETRREERAAQRAEQRPERKLSASQRAQQRMAEKANTPAPPPLPTDEDIINAALGVTEVVQRPSATREARTVARTKAGWAEPPDGQVRIMYARRDQRWWIVLPESNARVCEEKFAELADAETWALEKGWTVVKVQRPRGEEAAA